MTDEPDGYVAESLNADPPEVDPVPENVLSLPDTSGARAVATVQTAAGETKTIYAPAPEGYRRANMVFKTGHNWPVDEAPEDLAQKIGLFLEGKEPFLELHDAKYGEAANFPRRTIAEDLLCVGTTWVKEVHAATTSSDLDDKGKEKVTRIWVPGVGYQSGAPS